MHTSIIALFAAALLANAAPITSTNSSTVSTLSVPAKPTTTASSFESAGWNSTVNAFNVSSAPKTTTFQPESFNSSKVVKGSTVNLQGDSSTTKTTPDSTQAYWNTSAIPAGEPAKPSESSQSYPTTESSNKTSYSGEHSTEYGEPIYTLFPDYTSQYNGANGAVDFDTKYALVSRNPKNGGADISTLLTFALDKKYAHNKCQVVFDLKEYKSSASGTKKAQIFTSLEPATKDTETWPNGNLRNTHIGSIDIKEGGRASWQSGSGPAASTDGYFDCSAIAGMTQAAEVVPQGDEVEISWAAGKDGLKVLVFDAPKTKEKEY